METTTVKIGGIQRPAYLNGRPRAMLIEALRPKAAGPTNLFVASVQAGQTQLGASVSSSTLYLARAKKKVAMVPAAA